MMSECTLRTRCYIEYGNKSMCVWNGVSVTFVATLQIRVCNKDSFVLHLFQETRPIHLALLPKT